MAGVAAAVAVAVLFRLVPFHRPPNLTPLGGLSLYGGGRLPWWAALLGPIVLGILLPPWGVLIAPPLLAVIFAFAGRKGGERI